MKASSKTSIRTTTLRELERELCIKRGSLRGNEHLNSFGTWDSLAVIMLITAIDKKYNVIVDPTAIASADTVDDLINIISATINTK